MLKRILINALIFFSAHAMDYENMQLTQSKQEMFIEKTKECVRSYTSKLCCSNDSSIIDIFKQLKPADLSSYFNSPVLSKIIINEIHEQTTIPKPIIYIMFNGAQLHPFYLKTENLDTIAALNDTYAYVLLHTKNYEIKQSIIETYILKLLMFQPNQPIECWFELFKIAFNMNLSCRKRLLEYYSNLNDAHAFTQLLLYIYEEQKINDRIELVKNAIDAEFKNFINYQKAKQTLNNQYTKQTINEEPQLNEAIQSSITKNYPNYRAGLGLVSLAAAGYYEYKSSFLKNTINSLYSKSIERILPLLRYCKNNREKMLSTTLMATFLGIGIYKLR